MKLRPNPPSSSRWLVVAWCSLALNVVLLAWLLGRQSRAAPAAAAPPPPAATPVRVGLDRELAPYAALGSYMAENNHIADLKWTEAQFKAFQDGFRASYEGHGLPLDEPAAKLRDEISRRVQTVVESERPDPVRDYFRFLREKENVQQTPSGLHYRITNEGTGETPKPTDTVVISYSARTPDGRPLPALGGSRVKVAVADLLPGMAEGVQLFRVGTKGLIYLPPSLSFREDAWPEGLPKGAPIAFFMELHDIIPAR